ncbi:uncharacterized protein LOC110461834 [Mizuhopecten yessoensis]|uniref:Mitochondria-eating protein C-terminal domain-containing protein n=1 Tax=Mizuhopecten yessoensis TaxID=6573 RepID=A0A210PZE3_MIZYE|nr:uncharacterized protein LOC110461834 [Mizuhopecten yessoensis]XP_021371199.1 uncharacterized protein LOC110461834 [Mizuhopecten yessoensis]XP_021371201.1 uncharacterized protein LOC110461834 [Mizuhopecten yessoensis]XP_021371202.1 uncharacterized protein LOC110461834 [Mizuhopecten yessoensis]OWF41866.1 hypothetical protein KP79_PYT12350 [Mizuhopecten yessoensis]
MGSRPSTDKHKQEATGTPSHSDQNQSHKKGATCTADDIHGNRDLNTKPEKELKDKIDTGSFKAKTTSLTGKAVKMTDTSQEKPGVHKSVVHVVVSTDRSTKDLNHNSEDDKEPTGQPRKNLKIVSKIDTTLRRLDDGNLQDKLRLMEWLQNKTKDLNMKVQHSHKNTKDVTNNAAGEEGEQNTDGDWSKVQQKIRDYKSAKQELLNVVSEIAGARLKNNNPAIADLSDKNRASKLAERFSELYDNEWTDVVEQLRCTDNGKKQTKKAEEELEEKCIHFMVDLVKVTYENCQKKAKSDLDKMIDIVVKSTTSAAANVDVSKRCKDFMKLQMSSGESLKPVIKLVRGEVDESAALKNKYSDFNKVLEENRHYIRYRASCVELCWYMCLQDPPVAMMADITTKSTKDHFRAYTRSGKYLGFVVWPALLLHENGPLLYKGVAQYTNAEPEQLPKSESTKI